MKLNWAVRFKNPVWVTGFLAAVTAFVYQVLGMFEIVPAISHETVLQLTGLIVNILVGFGVLVDPTTAGASDSPRAMTYTEPMKYGH